MDFLDLISRWVHIGSAAVLFGGAVFSRFVLLPAAAALPEAEHEQLRAGVLSRWKRFIHLGIALLFLTGFYNFVRAISGHKGQGAWHGLVGMKILLAFVLFFLASAIVGRSSLAVAMRKNAKFWMSVIVLLGATIICISGYAKVKLPPRPAASAAIAE